MYAVSSGVAFGISTGVAKIIFQIPIAYLLIPGYVIAIALTIASSEEFVNIAWDSAGVTTGPVTVPLVLAMGLGFGKAIGAVEGFGILSMASIGPIVAVLGTGIYVRWKVKRRHENESFQPKELEEGPNMSTRELTILTDVSMITCVVQRDKADAVIAAAQEVGAQGATVHFDSGTGLRGEVGSFGISS